MSAKPLLYSFRRCPYAIRARLAIAQSGVSVLLHEVDLKAKPEPMLQLSPKGTVPVLLLPDGRVIDESLDIMLWALRQNDPHGWLSTFDEGLPLIQQNDHDFKKVLDRYKYPERHPEFSQAHYREQAELVLRDWESRLQRQAFLSGEKAGIADLAILPFVRQFAQVDRAWFDASAYRKLGDWLSAWVRSDLFLAVIRK